MSAHPKKGNPACYVNLRKGIDKGKEAIIVLTPFIFAPFVRENGKVIEPEQTNILHEIAHHVFGHYEYKDQQDYEEKAAREQAKKWVNQWLDFKTNG